MHYSYTQRTGNNYTQLQMGHNTYNVCCVFIKGVQQVLHQVML